MCEGSTPTLPFCDAQGSENPAPPFITDVRSSSREAASQSSRSNFRAVTESLARLNESSRSTKSNSALDQISRSSASLVWLDTTLEHSARSWISSPMRRRTT